MARNSNQREAISEDNGEEDPIVRLSRCWDSSSPFNTSTSVKFSTLKEDLDKKTEHRPCRECGIRHTYLLVLLNWLSSYLTDDDSPFFGRINFGTNGERYYENDSEDKERHQFMLRMYFGAIIAQLENPFDFKKDQSSEYDPSEDDASEDDASEDTSDDASEDDASEDDTSDDVLEDDASEDNTSDDASEDDTSEHASEDDTSDDASEDDASEDDTSDNVLEDDASEDDIM